MARIILVGRPNVGKSALYNALALKKAIVHATAGVTRDYQETEFSINGARHTLIDTAGIIEKEGELADKLNAKSESVLSTADVILFVLDGKEGLTAADNTLARKLLKLNKPVIPLINKADTLVAQDTRDEAYGLGFNHEPLMVSAAHTDGIPLIKEAVAAFLPESELSEKEAGSEIIARDDDKINIAIIGRPNAGKSTLTNTLLKEERMIAGPEAGLTREAIAHPFMYNDVPFNLIDTPGLRRKTKVTEDLEQLMVASALRAIDEADVVILVCDVSDFDPTRLRGFELFEQQDAKLAGQVLNDGKPLIIALNKWDEVEDKPACLDEAKYQASKKLSQVPALPIIPISAIRGKGLDKLFDNVLKQYKKWHSTFGTSQLNKVLEAILAEKMPPLSKGKSVKIKYMTQVGSKPPTFALWGSRTATIPSSYKRFLSNRLRKYFELEGIPLKFVYKDSHNPFSKK